MTVLEELQDAAPELQHIALLLGLFFVSDHSQVLLNPEHTRDRRTGQNHITFIFSPPAPGRQFL